jgi:hypothetical protein
VKGHKNYQLRFTPALLSNDAEFVEEYDSLLEAVTALNAIANYTLLLHEASLMPDHSNTGEIYKNSGDFWEQINEDGEEI